MDHVKLFIPGPIEVSPHILEAMTQPMIGHRSQAFKDLMADIQPRLREAFGTARPVYVSTSSAWGVMEGAIRNLVKEGVLCCMSGAFSDKWLDVAKRCGKRAEGLQVEWGEPITPERLREALKAGSFDTVTLIHNETSTGTMNPLAELCALVRTEFPDICLVVDAVSSFSAVPIPFEALGMDVLLTGSQKALALPPGLSLFALSDRALDRAATVPDRGYYFDFLEFQKNGAENMTPSTPCIPHIYGLRAKLAEIVEEGWHARFQRHERINGMVRDWVRGRGFELFPRAGYESRSLCCVRNTRGIDVAAMVKALKTRHHLAIDGGYGKIKGTTFRISTMGDETESTVSHLLTALDDVLKDQGL